MANMQIKQECVILYTQPYSIKDEKTGKLNEGISVHYLSDLELLPRAMGESRGVKPSKDSIGVDKQAKIQQVPGVYEILFDVRSGSNGKLELRTMDLDFVSTVKLTLVD